MENKLTENVIKFLDEASKRVGKHEVDSFHGSTWIKITEEIESPIEQLFYCAIRALQKINSIPDSDEGGEGLYIYPQYKIDNYRVDFHIRYAHIIKGKCDLSDLSGKRYTQILTTILESHTIIIECDSQEFHEKTEKERRYEKNRDRELLRSGYKVFHFTGKEIIENPYKVAAEALKEVYQDDICESLF